METNIQLSWKNVDEIFNEDDSEYLFDELCKKSVASDFYFDVREDAYDHIPTIVICAKDYFDDNGFCFDQHINIDHLLDPNVFEEMMEGIYVVDNGKSVEDIRAELIKAGFIDSKEFSEFLSEHQE